MTETEANKQKNTYRQTETIPFVVNFHGACVKNAVNKSNHNKHADEKEVSNASVVCTFGNSVR